MDLFRFISWGTRNEENLVERDTGSRSYYWMLAFATCIATLGLLVNNSTVIIGAMLIAPLLIPLSSLAVSIARGNAKHILLSLSHISMSILVIVAMSALLAWLIPIVGIPEEVLTRAKPNIFDLLIALTAGAAGMYAYLHKEIPESLAGVGISVSLVPPLSVVGIGIALGNWALAIGATVLFFINMVAIISSSLVVLFGHGRMARKEQAKGVAVAGWVLTLFIILVLAMLLGGAFVNTYKEERIRDTVGKTLKDQLKSQEKFELQSYTVIKESDQIMVQAVIRLPDDQMPPDVDELTDALTFALDRSVTLEISLLRTQRVQKVLEPSISPTTASKQPRQEDMPTATGSAQ
jgi:uncharacterized hydrophobic protein (TIGR00271 family)